jgi:hypothetical protein
MRFASWYIVNADQEIIDQTVTSGLCKLAGATVSQAADQTITNGLCKLSGATVSQSVDQTVVVGLLKLAGARVSDTVDQTVTSGLCKLSGGTVTQAADQTVVVGLCKLIGATVSHVVDGAQSATPAAPASIPSQSGGLGGIGEGRLPRGKRLRTMTHLGRVSSAAHVRNVPRGTISQDNANFEPLSNSVAISILAPDTNVVDFEAYKELLEGLRELEREDEQVILLLAMVV